MRFDRRRSPVAQRASAAALAALWILAQAASLFHASLDSHAVCPEHGELVHVAGVEGSAGGESPADGPSARRGEEPAEEHEHCGLSSAHRERSTALFEPAPRPAPPDAALAPAAAAPERAATGPALGSIPARGPPELG